MLQYHAYMVGIDQLRKRIKFQAQKHRMDVIRNMATFDSWWKKTGNIPPTGNSCSTPACDKYPISVCETTFDTFLNTENTLIPEFYGNLTDRVVIQRCLGGGKSGAYLFVVKIKNEEKISDASYVLKLYVTAYNSLGKVQDTRPFREVYTQCAMSGFEGYNCLLGFGYAPWESVADMLATTTEALYTRDFKKHATKGDARMITVLPEKVLFMISSFTSGVPLFHLDLIRYGNLMPGILLNILATHQKAERRLGTFTHWDLHADNIFIDTNCQNRALVPLSFVGNFSSKDIWDKLDALSPEKSDLAEFQENVWIPIIEDIDAVINHYRKTGDIMNLEINDPLKWVQFSNALPAMQLRALQTLQKNINDFLERRLVYPKVTLIDFDLAHSDQFSNVDPVHKAKLSSPLPIAERTLTWLMQWIPAAHVLRFTQLLFALRIPLKKKQSDVLHILCYVFVTLVYWELPRESNYENLNSRRLSILHERGNFVFSLIKQFVEKVPDLTISNIHNLFTRSLFQILPTICSGPELCGISPVMAINYVHLSSVIAQQLRSCTADPNSYAICRFDNAFQIFGTTRLELQKLLKNVHAALVTLNIQNFMLSQKFITLDDIELLAIHEPTNAVLYIHVEVPWDEISSKIINDASWFQVKQSFIQRFTRGYFSLSCKMLNMTNMSFQVKNGADLVFEINTNMALEFYGYTGAQGNQYRATVSNSKDTVINNKLISIVADTNKALSFNIRSIRVSKVGPLVEIAIDIDSFKTYLTTYLAGLVQSMISWLLYFFMPPNANAKHVISGETIKIIVSLPPSEEPIHACIGFVTDFTNISMGLNCLSGFYSLPSILSKLLKSFDLGTHPVFRKYLNHITAYINLKEPLIPSVPIWSIQWTELGLMEGDVELHHVPVDIIEQGLRQYLAHYKGTPIPPLPPVAEAINQELMDLDEWDRASVDSSSFNIEYVKYLCDFLKEDGEEEFFSPERPPAPQEDEQDVEPLPRRRLFEPET